MCKQSEETLKCKYCNETFPRFTTNNGFMTPREIGFKLLLRHCETAHPEIARRIKKERRMQLKEDALKQKLEE